MRQRFKNETVGPRTPDQPVEEIAYTVPDVDPGILQETLEQAFGIPFDRPTSRDLADGLIYRVQDHIREQSCYAGYSPDWIIE
jgi:hypothetical protein